MNSLLHFLSRSATRHRKAAESLKAGMPELIGPTESLVFLSKVNQQQAEADKYTQWREELRTLAKENKKLKAKLEKQQTKIDKLKSIRLDALRNI